MGRAIVRDPRAFLMDEPLSNLDAKLRVQMRTEVSRIQHRLGTTTVYVTHDQTEAMTLGDRVAVMRAGVLQQVGAPKELYDNPVEPLRRGLHRLAGDELLARRDRGRQVQLPIGDVRAARRSARGAGPRPGGAAVHRGHPPRGLRGRRAGRRRTATAASTFEATIDAASSRWAPSSTRYFARRGRAALESERARRAGRRTPAPPTCPAPRRRGQVVARLEPRERGPGGRPQAGCGSTPTSCTSSTRARHQHRSAGGLSDHPRRPPTGRGRRGCRPGGRHGILLSHLIPHRRAEIVRSSDRRP